MPSFPRTIRPRNVGGFRVPTGLVAPGVTGKDQLRTVAAMGREWDEVHKPLRAGDADVAALIAAIEYGYARQVIWDVEHYISPGSGRAPNGTGGGVPLVNGASQAGASLNTDGWTPSVANIVRAGDVIRIDGMSMLFRIVENASSNGSGQCTLMIDPPLYSGSSPADNAPITRSDCKLSAYISAYTIPNARPGEWMEGITVTFREALT